MTTSDSAGSGADDGLLLPEWLPAVEGRARSKRPTADAAVLAALYEEFYPRLVKLCHRRVRDAHLAEDIAQEAILQAARYFGTYDRTRPLWPWIRTIALRIASRDLNRTAAEWSNVMSSDDPLLASAFDPLADADRWALLRAALAAVPRRQRAALVVRYLNDWTTIESSRLFQMEPNAFEQLLWRARRRLAAEYRRLAEEDRDEPNVER